MDTVHSTPTTAWQAWCGRASRYAPVALALIPILWLGLAVFGVVRAASPVPFWDMWDHYVMAYADLRAGAVLHALFHQANEHRIPLSEVLFAIDLTAFGGMASFLFVCNVVLMVLTWAVLSLMARHMLRGHGDLWIVVTMAMAAPALSWLHESNLTWAYQSQFFFAYLVPLAAFACLARDMEEPRPGGWFAAALVVGVCSLGTMANGIFAMPLMAVMWLLGPRRGRAGFAALCVIGAIATAMWFHNYAIVPRDKPQIANFLFFIVTFLGAPFQDALQSETAGLVGGCVFLGASLLLTVRWMNERPRSPMFLALLAFLAYTGASAAMVSWGRAAFNRNAAISTRYATPALIAWCALMLALAYALRKWRHARLLWIAVAVAAALFLRASQVVVLSPNLPEVPQKRNLAGLALKLGIFDTEAIPRIYPLDSPGQIDLIKRASAKAAEMRISIFADPAWSAAVDAIGADASRGFHACRGLVEGRRPVAGEDRYARISGWAYDAAAKRVPPFVHIAADGKIVGVAVPGVLRRDVRRQHGGGARFSGFDGYVAAPEGAALEVVCAD
jgi:hypothetical protein